ncbi:amino acid transporter heavy chain SLC3A2 [Engraulis encrasicolus]|uniref:amino acid transporter heavy chain SLC3A2 n=1 Tax=Engraulis encrasicolus TaxID=184585 RepID=UPI002FD3724A
MPLNADGDLGYGSVAAAGPGPGVPGLAGGNLGGGETVPLLLPEPVTAGRPSWKPLSKDELELTAGSPGWRKVRTRLVLLFWLTWLVMLGAAIAIIVQSPRPVAPPLKWWEKELFYRLQPALLMDTPQGAIGGFEVMRERLPYLKSLQVGALILEGVIPKTISASNLTQVSHDLGTMPQFRKLIGETHKEGMKILLDFCDLEVMNEEDSLNATEDLADSSGYIQYSLKYWLEQGISGFSICDTDAAYTEKTLEVWKSLLEEYSEKDNERILVVRETSDSYVVTNVSDGVNGSLVQLTVRSLLPPSAHPLPVPEVARAIEESLQAPRPDWSSWTVGGPVAPELQRIIMVVLMTLPGTPVVSDGEEVNPAQNTTVNAIGDEIYIQDEGKKWRSAIALFQSLSHTRSREEALLFGTFSFLPFNSSSLTSASAMPPLAFLRSWGCVHFLVLLNLGPEPHPLSPDWAPRLPTGGVFVTSTEMDRLGSVSLETLILKPREGIVIKLFEGGSFS